MATFVLLGYVYIYMGIYVGIRCVEVTWSTRLRPLLIVLCGWWPSFVLFKKKAIRICDLEC